METHIMNQQTRSILGAVALSILAGCTRDMAPSSISGDASHSHHRDAGSNDSGVTQVDAVVPAPDGGVVVQDAGFPATDSGVAQADAGSTASCTNPVWTSTGPYDTWN